jgi:hypothetical protein
MRNAITAFDFDKLQALVDEWVIRYNHIAEISFFQIDDNKQPFGIELVLCFPPGIAPKWCDPLPKKDGFIKYGPDFLKQEIIKRVYPPAPPAKIERPGGHLYDYGGKARKETELADRWVVLIRWETDPSYFEHLSTDNPKMLYSAPTVDSIDGIFRKFSAEDYEHFGRLSYFTEEECLDLLIGFPLSEKDIHNPRVRLSKEARGKKSEALKWIQNWSKNVDRTEETLNRAIENDELQLFLRNKGILAIDAGPFLKWAREKGFHIPIDVPVSTDGGLRLENQNGIGHGQEKLNNKKLRPDQEDKQSCQEIAKRVWNDQPILDIKHMMNHPEILNIIGKQYKGKNTLRGWLSEIAPERAKKPGRRTPEVRKEQDKICEQLGILI